MIGDSLNTQVLQNEVDQKYPDFDKIKSIVLAAFNSENGKYHKSIEDLSDNEKSEIIKWLNRCFEHPSQTVTNLFLRKIPVMVPVMSQSLSSKISFLSQFHCPICNVEESGTIIMPIRISAISKQSSLPETLKAFEKAVASRFEGRNLNFSKGEKLCVHTVFVLSKNNRDKDLDNMSKALMDSLEKKLFENDIDIQHSSLLKIHHKEEDDFIMLNFRRTDINKHHDVMFDKLAHDWAGQKFLDLNDFMD